MALSERTRGEGARKWARPSRGVPKWVHGEGGSAHKRALPRRQVEHGDARLPAAQARDEPGHVLPALQAALVGACAVGQHRHDVIADPARIGGAGNRCAASGAMLGQARVHVAIAIPDVEARLSARLVGVAQGPFKLQDVDGHGAASAPDGASRQRTATVAPADRPARRSAATSSRWAA
mgnify:CR=1 FL=1